MAYSSTNWFNNSKAKGAMTVGANIDVFATDLSPRFAVGTKFTRSDGAKFTYCHFGTAVTRGGTLVAQDLSESGSANSTTESRILASASTTALAGETINPGTTGSRFVQYKNKGISKDQFAGGYLQVTAGSGMGYQYRILGNTASAQLTSGAVYTFYIELSEPLQQSLGGDSKVRIVGSQYANLESASAATDCFIAGVTTCSHAASTYGWVQEGGIAGVQTEAKLYTAGSCIALSETTAGQIDGLDKATFSNLGRYPFIGYVVAAGSATTDVPTAGHSAPVKLKL